MTEPKDIVGLVKELQQVGADLPFKGDVSLLTLRDAQRKVEGDHDAPSCLPRRGR